MNSYKQWQENLMQNDPKHMLGNYAFAIQTNIEPLRKRITEGRTNEALNVLNDIEMSIKKVNDFLAQME